MSGSAIAWELFLWFGSRIKRLWNNNESKALNAKSTDTGSDNYNNHHHYHHYQNSSNNNNKINNNNNKKILSNTLTATSAAVPQYEKNNNVRYQQLYNYSVPRTTKITTISDYNKDNNYDNKRKKRKAAENKSNDNKIDKEGKPNDDGEEDEEEYFYDSNCCDEINVKRRSSLIRLSILVLIPASLIAIASVCFGKVA